MKKIANGFFIVGTDTGVGKTTIAVSLLILLAYKKLQTIAIKPVASGSKKTSLGWQNEDALLLQKYSTYKLKYSQINPFALIEPIPPHLAAVKMGVKLSAMEIVKQTKPALSVNADYIIIEGAGGIYTPLNDSETMVDLMANYGYPVILVVGIKLGCINHAILTLESIYKAKIRIFGWVANVIDLEINYAQDIIEFLEHRLNIPLIGVIPFQNSLNYVLMAKLLDKFSPKIIL